MEQPDFSFDPNSDAFTANPYASYKALREREGLYYCPDLRMRLLARYKDVLEVATHPAMVRSLEAFLSPEEISERRRAMNWHDMAYHARYVQRNLLDSDGETHRRLRTLVFAEFTARSIEHHKTMIGAYIDKTLTPLIEQGSFDFIDDFASHIPGHIIGRVIGVPAKDCTQLRKWSEDVVQFYNVGRTQEDKALAENATKDFAHYLMDLISRREKNPKDDLLSKLIKYKNDKVLNETELISTAMLILMAGHGSTIDVLGSGLHCLLKNPDQMAKLRANPDLMANAIQEIFRFETPLPFFHRYTSENTEILGQHFKQGDQFGLIYASANRDPEVFPFPDRFDICRTPNRHLSFGKGPHLCLGNHLSRIDMEMVFTKLLESTNKIELQSPEPRYKKGLSVRGPINLPITVKSRA